MKHFSILLFALTLFTVKLNAQLPLFSKIFADSGAHGATREHIITLDGGYALLMDCIDVPGIQTVNVIKVSATGHVQWVKTVAGTEYRVGQIVQSPADSSYFVSTIDDAQTGRGYILIHIDKNGNLLWYKKYKHPAGLDIYQRTQAVATPDGGLVVSGMLLDTGMFTYTSYWHLFKVDAAGNVLWTKRPFSAPYLGSFPADIDRFPNGDFVILGDYYNTTTNKHEVMLVRTDSSGAFLWAHRFTPTLYHLPHSVIACADNSIVGCSSMRNSSFNEFPFLFRTDSAGNLLWGKIYSSSFFLFTLAGGQTPDGGFALTGGAQSVDGFMLKTDSLGVPQWCNFYNNLCAFSIDFPGNGFSLFGADTLNYLERLLVVDSIGQNQCNNTPLTATDSAISMTTTIHSGSSPVALTNIPVTWTEPLLQLMEAVLCNWDPDGVQEENESLSVRVFPVPAHFVFTIESEEPIVTAELYNVNGERIRAMQPGAKNFSVDVTNLSAGIYLLRMETGNGFVVKKIIVE